MPAIESFQETYRERLEISECYTIVSDSTQRLLTHDVRRYGLHSFDRVAHGILAFCIDDDSPVCIPWLVSPYAADHDLIGGRHGLVTAEFYPLAEEANLGSYKNGSSEGVDYDDIVGTYIIHDGSNETPFTVVCDVLDSGLTHSGHIDLISALSHGLNDHQVLIGSGGETTERSFLKIRDGSVVELDYGSSRGYELETLAASDDFVGKARELENYAAYAKKHGLDQREFSRLASNAVQAFRDGHQVSLDELCVEIKDQREQND